MSVFCPLCKACAPYEAIVLVEARPYYACPVCGLLYLDPGHRLDPAGEEARYRQHQNRPEDAGYVAFLDRLRLPVLARLSECWPNHGSLGQGTGPACPRGLDYGSGPTPVLAHLMAEAGYPVLAYDPFFSPMSQEAIAAGGPYDYILCCEVAEHFYRPLEEFAFLRSLLAPEGFLAVMTSLYRPQQEVSRWHYLRDATHVAVYQQRTLEWLAARLDWELSQPAATVAFFTAATALRGQRQGQGC